MTSYRSAGVKCPFYIGDERGKIICEGASRGAYLSIWFGTTALRDAHMSEFCTKFTYCRCPYAAAAERKYEDEQHDKN